MIQYLRHTCVLSLCSGADWSRLQGHGSALAPSARSGRTEEVAEATPISALIEQDPAEQPRY